MTNALDRIDRHILRCLQLDNKVSNLQLAEEVGLSPPACLRRVRRLREEGIIVADVSLVNPRLLGRVINIIVEVEMNRDQLDVHDAFMLKMQAAPEVTQCYQVTGDVDFVLVVMVADMEAYEAFARRELASDINLRKFRSLISLKRNKFSTAVDLDQI
ncbi:MULTISPECIES: Lrp/AsnC family transcriptional regulator [unclassified Neptuniibacter]|uniref:Lrp/AsnC family transcriptional regulator n=1 Tax=unclassified Neptuniibacter TaxID=2630693 RepID=UPI000C64408A|nr:MULTISPECIES: Lrp/AsnC family transcriptional regulator [unclassified Neptuniibacter]MAY42039.1 ArsR family transcriptional regulator [Oceanospirillaceae bacterium]|tara:strand:+ start:26968 stop:27441 length:474 start_codon:yes stop_codon:yes gene_type:complete